MSTSRVAPLPQPQDSQLAKSAVQDQALPRHGPNPTGEHLYVPGNSLIHLLPPQVKIVAMVGFVLVVVTTPPAAVWAFGSYLAAVVGLLALARIPARLVAPRMLVEVPFLLFAMMMPVIGTDPQVQVGRLWLSEPGLWAAWALLAKGTIGVLTAILLAATTPVHDLLGGLRRLRFPAPLVQIAGFMVRYLNVVGAEAHRMRIARESRGFQARGLRAWPVQAAGAGRLFIRSYERGERVHLAMLSRGYAGVMPDLEPAPTSGRDWVIGLLLPACALVVAALVRL
jgi:cobalt/nickel transport system permease protein